MSKNVQKPEPKKLVKKTIFTIVFFIILIAVFGFIDDMVSTQFAGSGVDQLNGSDMDYAISKWLTQFQFPIQIIISFCLLWFIWRKEVNYIGYLIREETTTNERNES